MRTCGDGGAPPSLVFGTAPSGRQSGRASDPSLWALRRAADPPQPRPGIPGDGSWASPFQSFLTARAGTCSLARPADLSKTGPMGTATPGQFLESLSNMLFILLSAKE